MEGKYKIDSSPSILGDSTEGDKNGRMSTLYSKIEYESANEDGVL